MFLKKLLIILFVLTPARTLLSAGELAVGGPVSGFLFDSRAGDIRPLIGVPGASYLGAPLVTGVAMAAIAPNGDTALAIKQDLVYRIDHLREFRPVWTLISENIPTPDRMVWNRNSTAIALYASGPGVIHIIKNGPGDAGKRIDVPELSGRLSGFALDESGELAVIAVDGEASGGVYLAPAESRPRLLMRLRSPAALALAGEDLFVADAERGQILEIRNYRTAPEPVLFLSFSGEAVDLAGMAVTRDGRVVLADKSTRNVIVFERTGRNLLRRIPLEFEPTRLEEFSDKPVYLLSPAGDRQTPLHILDGRGSAAAYFIPGGAEE
jgi:hypothetical protein